MWTGKLPPRLLQRAVLAHRGARRPDVLLGPAVGEDAAVIDLGDELCVIASDPITGAAAGAGRLAVHVAANDVAVTGAAPVGVQVVLLWPPEPGVEARLAEMMAEVSEAASELGIAVLGGHTEVTSRVDGGLIIATCVGKAPRGRYVTSGGGRPGDRLVLVRAAGLEGTGILAADHAPYLASLDEGLLARARGFLQEISVVQAALTARDAGVTAMHDVTEGGVLGAVWELAQAAGVGATVHRKAVPVRPETAAICAHLGIDPLGLLGSGALIVAAPDEGPVIQALAARGFPAVAIGRLEEPGEPVRVIEDDGRVRTIADCPEDELWRWLRERS